MDNTLSVQEAAAYYNVSPATIRRRIKAGELRAFRQRTPQGYEWRIYSPDQQRDDQVPTVDDQPPTHDDQLRVIDDQPSTVVNTPISAARDDQPPYSDDQPSARDDQMIRLLERMHQENVQLAGQVGYLQRQVLELQEQVRMLTMDKEPEAETHAPQPEPEPETPSEPRSALWQWVRRRLSRT